MSSDSLVSFPPFATRREKCHSGSPDTSHACLHTLNIWAAAWFDAVCWCAWCYCVFKMFSFFFLFLSCTSCWLSGWHNLSFCMLCVPVGTPSLLFSKVSQGYDARNFKEVRGAGVLYIHRHVATTLRAKVGSLSFVIVLRTDALRSAIHALGKLWKELVLGQVGVHGARPGTPWVGFMKLRVFPKDYDTSGKGGRFLS